MTVHQRYVRPRTILEGLCVTAGCQREGTEQVPVLLGRDVRIVTVCARHAVALRRRPGGSAMA